MKPFLRLKSVDEVERIIFTMPALGSETVSLEAAFGSRIAKTFYAPENLPGFDRSSMDGFAVRARDVFGASESGPALLRVIGQCRMGQMPTFALASGEAATIPTGAPLPKGADAVVMVEHSREAGNGQVEIIRSVSPGANVVEQDEDAKKGEALIPQGKRIRAQEAGILAAFGIQTVEVARMPKVAIFSSGDEITTIDTTPKLGQLRDVNSWSLDALCRANGSLPARMGIIGDEPHLLKNALLEALPLADVVIVSGGSSAGTRDHTLEAFASMPEARILAHGVAISPGKPFILATSGAKCLLGLPGHVTGALICAHVFLEPLLQRLQGLVAPAPRPFIEAELTRSIASAQGRREYIRCRLNQKDDHFEAMPLRAPSAVLSGLLEADGYIICPENSEGLASGQKVRVYPL